MSRGGSQDSNPTQPKDSCISSVLSIQPTPFIGDCIKREVLNLKTHSSHHTIFLCHQHQAIQAFAASNDITKSTFRESPRRRTLLVYFLVSQHLSSWLWSWDLLLLPLLHGCLCHVGQCRIERKQWVYQELPIWIENRWGWM